MKVVPINIVPYTPHDFTHPDRIILEVPKLVTTVNRSYTTIVSLHNKESTIEYTINSVFDRSRRPYEVIVVNDASTDHSHDIIEKFKNEITIIDNEKNIDKAKNIKDVGKGYDALHPYSKR